MTIDVIALARGAGASMLHDGEYALMGNLKIQAFATLIRNAVLSEVAAELSRHNQAWEPIHKAREDCIAAVEAMKEPTA